MLQYLGGSRGKRAQIFESAEVAFPSATVVASALHGLGSTPRFWMIRMRCTTAELGYSVGDEVALPGASDGDGARRAGGWANATTIGWKWNAGFSIYNRTTDAVGSPTAANWKLIFSAIK